MGVQTVQTSPAPHPTAEFLMAALHSLLDRSRRYRCAYLSTLSSMSETLVSPRSRERRGVYDQYESGWRSRKLACCGSARNSSKPVCTSRPPPVLAWLCLWCQTRSVFQDSQRQALSSCSFEHGLRALLARVDAAALSSRDRSPKFWTA